MKLFNIEMVCGLLTALCFPLLMMAYVWTTYAQDWVSLVWTFIYSVVFLVIVHCERE